MSTCSESEAIYEIVYGRANAEHMCIGFLSGFFRPMRRAKIGDFDRAVVFYRNNQHVRDEPET